MEKKQFVPGDIISSEEALNLLKEYRSDPKAKRLLKYFREHDQGFIWELVDYLWSRLEYDGRLAPFTTFTVNWNDLVVIPDWDALRLEGVPSGEDYREAPRSTGFYLEVNDHGNATLFSRTPSGEWREEWAVV